MKNNWAIFAIIALIVAAAIGYANKTQLKQLLMGRTGPSTRMTYGTPAPSQTGAGVVITTRTDSKKGNFLAAGNGMTLYTFDKDMAGVSNCNADCTTIWPPYILGAISPTTLPTNVTAIKRADGSMQYAYNGMPLYFYSNDKQPGDLIGDGFGGIWHIVKL